MGRFGYGVRFQLQNRRHFTVPAVAIALAVNTVLPVITRNTDNAEVGTVLTSTTGTWTGTVFSYSFQWKRDGVAISGANTDTYQTVAADGDKTITCDVGATNPAGTVTATSAGLALVFPVAALANAATAPTSLTQAVATLTTTNITVSDAANRKLIGMTMLPRSETITNVDCSFDGGTTWLAMTAAYNPGVRVDASDNSNVSIWYYDNPPIGTAIIRFTRTPFASTNTRWFWHACVLQNVAAGGPIATGGNIQTTNGATFTSTTGPTSTAKNQKLVGIVHIQETTANANPPTSSTDTISNTVHGGGNVNRSVMFHRNVTGVGAQNSSFTDPDTNSKFANFAMAIFAPVPYVASSPVYYVDNTRADDTGNGKSEGTAFKTLNALTSIPKVPGFTANLKGGQIHRLNGTGRAINIAAGGSVSLPISVQRNGAGTTAISGGIEYSTGWGAISAGEAATYAVTNGQKRAMGVALDPCQGPIMDGKPLHPAVWSPTGVPAAAGAWDYVQKGSGAVRFATTFQNDAGTTADLTKEIAYQAMGSGVWQVTITHAAIAAHYGSNSPVGAYLYYRSSGNQTQMIPITSYDQANSRIVATSPSGGTSDYQPYNTDPYYQIRFSPFDLVKANQYALSADRQTVFAVWPTGTVKAVARQTLSNILNGGYIRLTNLDVTNVSINGELNGEGGPLLVGGANQAYTDVRFRYCWNEENPACIYPTATLTNSTFTRVDGDNCRTHSLFRFVGATQGVTVSGSWARGMGRTIGYAGGTSSGIIFEDCDWCDHLAVHGNVSTVYQGATDVEFRRIAAMGAAQGHTSQIKNAPSAPANKNVRLKQSIFTGHRDPLGAFSVDTWLIRLDGGDSGSLIDQVLVPLGPKGLYIDNSSDPFGTIGNNGLVVSRSVLLDATILPVPAGTTLELRDCIIMRALAGSSTSSEHNTNQVLQTRCTYLSLTASDILNGTNGAWNGCPTVQMQEHITRVSNFNPAAPTYAAAQIGPNLWGKSRNKGPWIIPAYGATFAMGALWITTDEVDGPYQSGKMVGSIAGGMPGSTLSLVSGALDNASFGLDRGIIYATTQLAVGTYTIRVRETNASATNGPTRDSDITITVYP